MSDPRLFSKAQRAQIFARAAGHCEKCNAKLKVGEGEYDHVIEYTLTRDTSVENGQLLCRPCHRGKTSSRAPVLAKVERLRLKHAGIWPASKAKIRSRGFDRSRPLPQEASHD